jgi:ribonuclease H / adenosylcobalamin/alpha-ribazole phosphatase
VIVLVRHGETEPNRLGRLLGRADPSLNERGRQQAEALATSLALGPTPDVVVTSPLQRARETAAAISTATGSPIRVDERLIELDYGEWDDRPLQEIPADIAARWRSDPTFAAPGGESLADLRARITPCAEALFAQAADGVTVVVSHVSPIKSIVCWALKLDDTYAWRLRLDVASISRLVAGLDGPVLLTFNETGHLR